MQDFFKSKIKVSILIIILAVAGYFIYKNYFTTTVPIRYVLAQASKQTIVSSVSGTGQVSQDRSVNINPPASGKITSINVKQGDKVKAGQTIAIMDETNTTITLNQARASLASAQANYDQTLAGATSQDIQLSQLSVDSAKQSLDSANLNLQTVTKQQAQAVATAQTNLLNAGLQAIPSSGNIGSGTIIITGTYTSTEQGSYKIIVYNSGSGQQFSVSGLETDTQTINRNTPSPLGTRGLYIQFSGATYNNDSWTINIPNVAATSYNANYVAYQTALTNQTAALTSAQNQITSAQNTLQQAKINLQTKQSPPTDQTLESAKAQLVSAQAQYQNAQINYDNNILKAPFDGTVAAVNNQVGDQVSASTNIAVITTNKSIAIIPLNEVDVAKVKVGDKATMTFQAVSNLVITGTVAQIDQLGTVSQGVVNYNVKITFDTEDDRVRPGMSVSVSIITDTQPDVLAVPNSAVQSQGSNNIVQIIDPSKTQSVSGQTGVTSSVLPAQTVVQIGASNDTYTQIISGIKEGDTVVTQTINPTATKSTAASATSALRIGGGGGGFGGGAGGATRPTTNGR